MRIVHLSDIHFGCWDTRLSALFDKRILGQLNYLLRRCHQQRFVYLTHALARVRALMPDVVVLTGDITSVGSPPEFALALETLRPLYDHNSFDLIYTPGNHDAYVRNSACCKRLEHAFQVLNQGRYQRTDMPYELERNPCRFMIIDGAVPSNWLRSNGQLSGSTVERVNAWADAPATANTVRVLIGHFPLRDRQGCDLGWRRRLVGCDPLYQRLADTRIDLSLCGHIHHPFVRRESGGGLEICAGALTVAGKLNVIDVTPADGTVHQFWEDVTGNKATGVPIADVIAPARVPQTGQLPACCSSAGTAVETATETT